MKEGSSSVCAMEHHSTASTIQGGAESDFREKKLTTWQEDGEWPRVRAQSRGGPLDPRSDILVQPRAGQEVRSGWSGSRRIGTEAKLEMKKAEQRGRD